MIQTVYRLLVFMSVPSHRQLRFH